MKVIRAVALLFICYLCAASLAQAQYLNPEITEKKVVLRKAVILPARIEIQKASSKGSAMMVAESEQTSKTVAQAVGQTLKDKKIAILNGPFEGDSADEKHKYLLADIQSRYDALLPKLVDKSSDVKKARFALGEEVRLLNVDKSADVIVFIRGHGRVFTAGKTAFSLLNPFAFDLPLVHITIGIIDARTGEVLVFTNADTVTKVIEMPNELNKLITKSLKKLPVSR